jgi:DGQHR domain-containing protein
MKINEEELNKPNKILAIKVQQWLESWDKVRWDESEHRRQPDMHFYLFSLSASRLRKLSGINKRERIIQVKEYNPQDKETGIQRRHDKKRSEEIANYVRYGYPLSEPREKHRLTEAFKVSEEFRDLQQPGWLPTAVIINILKKEDKRKGKSAYDTDLLQIKDINNQMSLIDLPTKLTENTDWKPQSLHPIEIIDGQHRLFAFDDKELDDKFEIPVVAFHGLDISWQAYLFWTINIRPVKINPSLAFDLYPLLRTEEWLEKAAENHLIYRQARAQELVELLWSYPESPWYQRINMLGDSGMGKTVKQAAWITSLLATYLRPRKDKSSGIGGLFGSPVGLAKRILPWSRVQQAAFLIYTWQMIRSAVFNCNEKWAEDLREGKQINLLDNLDPAFGGSFETLLNTNIGTRGFLYITNDLTYIYSDELDLENWLLGDEESDNPDQQAITNALESLLEQPVASFIRDIADHLASYDWRTPSAPGLSSSESQSKKTISGGSGYKELRLQLLHHLENSNSSSLVTAATKVLEIG